QASSAFRLTSRARASGCMDLRSTLLDDLPVRTGDRVEQTGDLGDVDRAAAQVRLDQVVEHEAVQPIEVLRDLAAGPMVERVQQLGDRRLGAPEVVAELLEILLLESELREAQELQAAVEHQEENPTRIGGVELHLLVVLRRGPGGRHELEPPLMALSRNEPCACRLLTRISRLVNVSRMFCSN